MKRTSTTSALSVLLLTSGSLTGCVVTAEDFEPGVYVPEGVAYVHPTYAAPGPGYYWNYHEGPNTWAWYHHDHGWHDGGYGYGHGHGHSHGHRGY